MTSKFHFGILLFSVIFVFGGGMAMASAQSSDTIPVYLPLVINAGTSPLTPTQIPTAIIPPTPIPTEVVQPITVALDAVEDANIGESGPDSNDGNPHVIWVGTYGGVESGLIKFDLSSIPTGSHIIAADINLNYQMRAGAPSPVPTFTITAYRNTTPWDESSVTWNSRPSTAEGYGIPSFASFGSKSFDAKNLVEGWVNGTFPNYGITLEGGANYNNFSVGFCPREGGTWNCNGSLGSPYLFIIYDQP